MITTLNLSADEFTIELFEQIKKMFAGSQHLRIEISNSVDAVEKKEEYKARILRAIDNVENKKNSASFSEKEFDELSQNLLEV